MIWGDELYDELLGLGIRRHYDMCTWLPQSVGHYPVVNLLISGHADIHAQCRFCSTHIGRCKEGELLGVRNNLYPKTRPLIRYKASTEIECMEIRWSDVEARIKRSDRLENILLHIAQTRLYGMIIATHPLFASLDILQRTRMYENAMVRMLTPGEHLILRQGSRSHLYLLVCGQVSVKSDERTMLLQGAGEVFGEMSLFGLNPIPTADVTAQSFCEVIEFRDEDMLAAMRDHPGFRQGITKRDRQPHAGGIEVACSLFDHTLRLTPDIGSCPHTCSRSIISR